MMLPILISVSLAPVSYFFCAWAVVAPIAAATAMAAKATRLRVVIVLSPRGICFAAVSQAARGLAVFASTTGLQACNRTNELVRDIPGFCSGGISLCAMVGAANHGKSRLP